MDKVKILLVVLMIIVTTVIVLELTGPEENIILSCSFDRDCYKSCSGCVSTASEVKQTDCSLSLSLCKCIDNTCKYILSEDEVLDILEDKFPERDKNINLNLDCEGGPCWEINITLGNASGGGGKKASMKMSGESGEIIEEECDNEDCKECDYASTQIMPWGEIIYYNTGCENPTPTCDVSNLCRACESEQDCVRKQLSSTIRLDIGQIMTYHSYNLLGTNITANYNETSMNCIIYDKGDEIYSDIVIDIAECEGEILTYVNCNEGCKPN